MVVRGFVCVKLESLDASMTTVAIAGATGLVGTRVVDHLARRGDVARIVAVGRRQLSHQSPKIRSLVVDLQSREAVSAALAPGTDVAFCCLGTTMKVAGSREAFRAVDYQAVVTFAAAALERGATRFLLVSAVGANAQSRNFYQRTKGEAEDAVVRLGFAQVTILRPSLIDDDGVRVEYRRAERLLLPLARRLFAVVGPTSRYAPVSAEVIARAMLRLGFDGTTEQVRIVESDRLHRLGADHPAR